MRSKLCAASLLLWAACSPANTPPPQPVLAPRAPAPVPVEPTGARWSFFGEGTARAVEPLPGGGVLRVGELGRRWIVRPNAAPEDAGQLAPAELVDVRSEAGRVLFLDARGGAHAAAMPLARFTSSHAGPKAELRAVAAGKIALLGLESKGGLHRSVDGGATWSTVALPARAGETAISLAANRKGEALALFHPQRLLASSDDGATWSVVTTPGFGAREVLRDDEGTLWLRGGGSDPPHARLVAGKLELGAPIESAQPAKPKGALRTIAGQRLVTRTEEKGVVSVSVAQLGSAVPMRPFPLDGTTYFLGAANTVVAAVRVEHPGTGKKSGVPTTKLFRTTDEGATWDDVGSFDGHSTWGRSVLVAPRWLAVGEICLDGAVGCTPARVKIGSEDWQPLALPTPKTRVHSARWDATHERIIAFGHDGDGPVLLRSAPTEAALTRVDVALPKSVSLRAMTVGDDGSVRLVFEGDEQLQLVRVAPDLASSTTMFLPFVAGGGRTDLDLAGDRGLAFSEGRAWETADGGLHWVDVGASESSTLQCNDAGCVASVGVRVGWDLAARSDHGIAATATKPSPKTEEKPKPHAIACVANGGWKNLSGELPWWQSIGLDHDVRYVAPPPADLFLPKPYAVTLARGAELPKSTTLMPAPPENGKNVRRWAETNGAGHVYIRYAFAPKNDPADKYNPVDVELAWVSARTGKAVKAKLSKMAPFRVGSESKSALASVVDGGLLFLPFGGDAKLQLLRDDGKLESFPRPPRLEGKQPWDEAWKRGDAMVLAAYDGADTTLAGTTDAGKTWKTATWTFGDDNGVRLVEVGKRAALSVTTRVIDGEGMGVEHAVGYVPLDGVTPDPLEFVAAKPQVTVCSVAGREGARAGAMFDALVTVTAKGEPPLELVSDQSIGRVSAGETCVAGVIATSDGDELRYVALVAPHDPTHALLLRAKGDDPFVHAARAMSCTIP